MPFSIPGPVVDFILLGPNDDRRQLQDSPILGDVWAAYGARPAERLELLIEPYRRRPAGAVARQINRDLRPDAKREARISCVHGFIAAKLTFEELLRHVAPLTYWWAKHFGRGPESAKKTGRAKKASVLDRLLGFDVSAELRRIFEGARAWYRKKGDGKMRETAAGPRFVALTGLILWAARRPDDDLVAVDARIAALLADPVRLADEVEAELAKIAEELPPGREGEYCVHSVSRNRKALPALERSVAAVKADAARSLFTVSCRHIGWAVLDSGIDASHPAFFDVDGTCRVRRSFEFSRFRDYVSLANADAASRKATAKTIVDDSRLLHPISRKEAEETLAELANNVEAGGALRWDLIERLVEIKPETPPAVSHGTHVAGILGASLEGAKALDRIRAEKASAGKPRRKNAPKTADRSRDWSGWADGVCPDINLYDFRVLAPELEDTEFAIIAALQFIRHLNQRDTAMAVHGANLSLSIPHNVRNYACGHTPICEECNRLSENGVVVVAAAGNHGYKTFTTDEGSFDSYAAFSITDPGNAENAITVGATHRHWPHTFGVSFFSSRGPTGDGRLKPDLVAPGEKIRAPLAGGQWGDQDGTSMAAPHVSGAAAMIMARYSEFRGRPRKIKQILCETATDLERERSFQGHGMLDVLRAFQSI